MFKDYDKYLCESLKVYLFLLIVICILKLVGLDYFGLDLNNVVMNKISNAISTTHWGDVYNFVTVYIQAYLMLCLSTNKKKLYLHAFIFSLILFTIQCLANVFFSLNGFYPVFSITFLLIYPMIINKKFCIKRQLIVVAAVTLYQIISMFIRSVGVNANYNNFLNWAIENGYKEGLTIDRINNDGNYEPNNCKWSTRAEQNRNMRKKTNFIKRYLLNVK